MHLLILVLCLFYFLFSGPIFAASSQAQMDISASIEPSCTVTSNNINFGIYQSSAIITTSILKVLCTKGTKFSIELGSGARSNQTFRAMSYGQNFLNYMLYQDSAGSRIWGSNNSALVGTGTGRIQIFKIYGKIPENQQLPSGHYFDNININLNIGKTSPSLSYQLALSMLVEATIENKTPKTEDN